MGKIRKFIPLCDGVLRKTLLQIKRSSVCPWLRKKLHFSAQSGASHFTHHILHCLHASNLYANLNLYNYRLTQTLIIPINIFPIL